MALPPDADADAVRAVLRELGEPEDVLREAALAGDAAGGVPGAAAQPEPAPAPRATAPAASEFGAEQPARVRLGWRDVAALILVATAPVTAFMPVVGLLAWAATMVVLLRSSTWTPSAKVLVSLLVMVTGVLSVLSMLPVMSGGSFSLNPPEVVRVMLAPILPGLAVYTFAAWALWR